MNASNDSSPVACADGLGEKIIELLKENSGLKAAELAKLLEVERREVNRLLAYDLAERVIQGRIQATAGACVGNVQNQ